jgi:putative exosortase-associated protein (TIGR04073 family)
MADFQESPGSNYTRVRKLSRALANIIYGSTEIPNNWSRTVLNAGSSTSAAYGTVHGVHKTLSRVGYGLYELVTFPFPTYKGGYRQPYHTKNATNPYRGYLEFPTEIGFTSGVTNCRVQVD